MNSLIRSARQSQGQRSSWGDDDATDDVEEIVVLAFGAFERYYVCWKSLSGNYHQVSSGLPNTLHEWLFPEDGSTRDFGTLQVVLGQREEYFAYDKDGRISNVTGAVQQQKKWDKQSSGNEPRVQLYRRQTVPWTDLEASLGPKANVARRAAEGSRVRSQSTRQVRVRPHSLLADGQFRWPLSAEQDLQGDRPSKRHSYIRKEKEAPRYADASVQTDPITCLSDSQQPEHDRDGRTASGSPNGIQSLAVTSAPMMMGTMNDYFRSGSYQLGDILQGSYYRCAVSYP